MARIIKNVDIQNIELDSEQTLWTYCALDCAVTLEIWQKIKKELDDTTSKTYSLSVEDWEGDLSVLITKEVLISNP